MLYSLLSDRVKESSVGGSLEQTAEAAGHQYTRTSIYKWRTKTHLTQITACHASTCIYMYL